LTPFSRYSFPDPADPRTVMIEALTTDLRLVAAADLAWYDAVVDQLLDVALPAAETAALLARLADDPALAAGEAGPQDAPVLPRPRPPLD
jgi:hypothetical protein